MNPLNAIVKINHRLAILDQCQETECSGVARAMDVCKIAPGIYQYTAIDDCSRFKILYTYPRRTAANSIDFLDRVLEQFVYPIQRIQTDRGGEFFAYCFQEKLREYCIKFRPIKPRSPHLNGNAERSQQTDLQEFHRTADLKDPALNDRLAEWQFYYKRAGAPVSAAPQFLTGEDPGRSRSREVSRGTFLG